MLGPLAQMPLADNPGLVAGTLEDFGHIELSVVQMGRQGGHPVDVVVGPAQDGRPARAANRIGAKTIIETHSLGRDPIQIGGLVDAAAVTAHRVGGVVVGHDKQNIGSLLRHRLIPFSDV